MTIKVVRDYVEVWLVFAFDPNPSPPPDEIVGFFQWCSSEKVASDLVQSLSGRSEVYHLWLHVNKQQLLSVFLPAIASTAQNFYLFLTNPNVLGFEPFFTESPRGAGINSVVEKDPDYHGTAPSAKKGGASTFTLSTGAYLQLIYEGLLSKGDLLHANTVKSILDALNAGQITDAEALDRLNAINFNQ